MVEDVTAIGNDLSKANKAFLVDPVVGPGTLFKAANRHPQN